jgi:hypothetical protein
LYLSDSSPSFILAECGGSMLAVHCPMDPNRVPSCALGLVHRAVSRPQNIVRRRGVVHEQRHTDTGGATFGRTSGLASSPLMAQWSKCLPASPSERKPDRLDEKQAGVAQR